MASDELDVTTSYLEHFTDEDFAFLFDPYRRGVASGDYNYRSLVRGRRGGVEGFLSDRDVFEALFISDRSPGPLMLATPFLAFAVAVQHTGTRAECGHLCAGMDRGGPAHAGFRRAEVAGVHVLPLASVFLGRAVGLVHPRGQWVGPGRHPPRACAVSGSRNWTRSIWPACSTWSPTSNDPACCGGSGTWPSF